LIKSPQQESCGIIYLDGADFVFLETENLSDNKRQTFCIDPQVILKYNPVCIVHSHINETAYPSDIDILNSSELCIPYLIYSLRFDEFYLYQNKSV